MDECTWAENETRIRQLWSEAQWGDENNALRDLFRRTLSTYVQPWLRDALEQVKQNYSSRQPELRWIAAAYEKIYEARRLRVSGASVGVEKWWVDWAAIGRFGTLVQFSSDAPSEEVAIAAARERRGVVRNGSRVVHDFQNAARELYLAEPAADARPVAPVPRGFALRLVRTEEVEPATISLAKYSRDSIRAVVAHLRAQDLLAKTPLNADPTAWSQDVLRLVRTELDLYTKKETAS